MLNQLLVGRYLVTEVLGEGGLAKTYIAIDQHKPSCPQCVVKILKPASKDSSFLHIARRLFNTEAQILDKLGKHSQIPQLLAYFEENKEFFIIQEYIAGHTLSTELPTGHRWTENKVILMLQDVLETLAFVHDSKVIHRDLKPNNLIRRDQDRKIVLIDFGAVKQVGDTRITTKMSLTLKTISIGTQGYMPLEQARGKPKFNSDIYSLGIIAIQALTGIDPCHLEEGADGEVIWRDYAKVSDPLAAILNQMVCYNFTNRYQSVSEVQQALSALNYPVFLSQFTSGDKQQGELLPESESREVRVSLKNKLLEIETIDSAVTELESTLEDIVPLLPLVELKQTKASLSSSEDLDQVKTIPEASTAEKLQTRDPWSTWDLEYSPHGLAQKPAKESNQANLTNSDSETIKADRDLENNDLWNLLSSATVAKSEPHLTNKQAETKIQKEITAVQADSEESEIVQDTVSRKPSVNPSPDRKRDQTLSAHKSINNNSSLISLPETRSSLKDVPNNAGNVSEIAAKATKPTLKDDKLKSELSLTDDNKTKACVDRKTKTSLLNIASSRTNKLNLFKLAKPINLQIEHVKLNRVWIALWRTAWSTPNYLSKISFSLILERKYNYLLPISAGISITVIGSYFSYRHFIYQREYSQAKIAFQKIETLKTTKKYQECIQQAQAATDNLANFNIDITSLIQDCSQGQLNAAKKLAKASRYKDAINLATAIPPEQDIYAESQELVTQWSNEIYEIATNKYNEGNLNQAIAILKAIPENSPVANEIESIKKQWRDDWQQNKNYIQTAQKALDKKQWQDAISEAKKVKDNPYWLKQSKELIKQAESAIASQSVPRKTYNPRTTTKVRTRTTPRTNTYSRPAPLPPRRTAFPTTPAPQSDSKRSGSKSVVCLNKNSRIPKCRK
ncbi:MAG: serine/threonine-protein kinase [Cyanobacteria bacterium P01_G01_bin.39]